MTNEKCKETITNFFANLKPSTKFDQVLKEHYMKEIIRDATSSINQAHGEKVRSIASAAGQNTIHQYHYISMFIFNEYHALNLTEFMLFEPDIAKLMLPNGGRQTDAALEGNLLRLCNIQFSTLKTVKGNLEEKIKKFT